jgi:hypothetical protein
MVFLMRFRIPVFVLVLLACMVVPAAAQDDAAPSDTPSLGDLARNLRKDKAVQQPQKAVERKRIVIDNDNLSAVVEDVKNAKPVVQDKTVLSLDSTGNTLKVSSPDVTCSMSFNARASALLVRPALVENLPLEELVKLDGPGSIQDDNLLLEVFNGSDWALREITIGLTLERRPGEDAERAAHARVVPAATPGRVAMATVQRHSDVTLLYHLKTETKPFTKTALRESIGITPGPDEDWRWSIVEAKGIRPTGARAAPESLSEPLYGKRVPSVPSTNAQPGAVIPPASPKSPQ